MTPVCRAIGQNLTVPNMSSRRAVAASVGVGVAALLMLAGCGGSSQSVAGSPSVTETGVPNSSTALPANLTKVTPSTPTGSWMSPLLDGNDLFISQSSPDGNIARWDWKSVPKKPGTVAVTLDPVDKFRPDLADKIKMEQIALDNKSANLLVATKAPNGSVNGGNSVWTYPFAKQQTTGPGTNLAGLPTKGGDGSQAWPGNSAQAAIAYTYAAGHFPKPEGSTQPTTVATGNVGGVAQAKNGFLYFGSMQSGCVYKQNMATSQTWAIYCIPSWGANNQNQSVYSLDDDRDGNVYALYQGSTDNNTIILKIKPGGNGQNSDTIQALQLAGYARSVGLAVTDDGSTIFANGVPMSLYEVNNTNTILTVNKPQWGTPESPTQIKAEAVIVPGAYNETWLTGMTIRDKGGTKNDRLIIGDNVNGFWVYYPSR